MLVSTGYSSCAFLLPETERKMSPRKATTEILINYQKFPIHPFPECTDQVRIVNWLLLYTPFLANQPIFQQLPANLIGAVVGREGLLKYAKLRDAVDIAPVSPHHTRSTFIIPHPAHDRSVIIQNTWLVARLTKTLVHVPDANLHRVYCPLIDARDDNRMCWWSIKLSDLINAYEYAKNQRRSLRMAVIRKADWIIDVELTRSEYKKPANWSLVLNIHYSPEKED